MRVVVVVDEAQYLPTSVLRDLQMLVNFDMDSRDLMALVLVGHSVLCQYLSRQPYESLRQRIVVNYRTEGLDEPQAKAYYVRGMLLKAGADPDIFDDAALAAAHGMSGGSIRRFNSVVVNALAIGAQQQARAVDAEMVRSGSRGAVDHMSCPVWDLPEFDREHWGFDDLCWQMGCMESTAEPGETLWLPDEADWADLEKR